MKVVAGMVFGALVILLIKKSKAVLAGNGLVEKVVIVALMEVPVLAQATEDV